MNDVVERVARAIKAKSANEYAGWDELARAAIEAMREPTEAMLRAIHDGPLLADDHEMSEQQRAWIADIWSTGIDAALADASPDIGKEG